MTATVVRGACPHDCPDTCAWHVTVEEGVATRLVGDPDHPFTHGGLCAKVNQYLDDRTYNPDRVLHPLARVGDRVRPGVVALPSGHWASRSPGGWSTNALTSDGIAGLGGGGDFHDTLVEVAPLA